MTKTNLKSKCPHQFFEVKKILLDKFTVVGNTGCIVMCALCAEQRKLWDDGSMEIIKKEVN